MLVVVQPFGPVVVPAATELKFSERRVGEPEDEMFEDDVRFMLAPEQIVVLDELIVTTGAGTIATETG